MYQKKGNKRIQAKRFVFEITDFDHLQKEKVMNIVDYYGWKGDIKHAIAKEEDNTIKGFIHFNRRIDLERVKIHFGYTNVTVNVALGNISILWDYYNVDDKTILKYGDPNITKQAVIKPIILS